MIPGPRYTSILSWFRVFRRDPLAFIQMCRDDYGRVASFRAPPRTGFVLADPEWVRHVLETHYRLYWKGRQMTRVGAAGSAGPGMVFLDGERWRRSRKEIQPAFVRAKLEPATRHMGAAADALIARLEASPMARGEPVELFREMSITALDVAARALFGVEMGERMGMMSDLMNDLLDHSAYLLNHPFVPPRFVPTRRNRAMARDGEKASEILEWVIAERRRHPPGDDLLWHMMTRAADPRNDFMTEKQLRAEAMTFLVAGHETTGATLAFALSLLADHPEEQERLHEEGARVLGGRTPTHTDLPSLDATRRVAQETMRLYPPAPMIGRQCYGGDEIAGCPVEAKAPVLMSAWVMHRDPDYWESPAVFSPDRFRPEPTRERPRYAYFPFGGGPRGCIGEAFAMAELPIVLSKIVERYRVIPVPERPVVAKPLLTLRPQNGVWLRLEARASG